MGVTMLLELVQSESYHCCFIPAVSSGAASDFFSLSPYPISGKRVTCRVATTGSDEHYHEIDIYHWSNNCVSNLIGLLRLDFCRRWKRQGRLKFSDFSN